MDDAKCVTVGDYVHLVPFSEAELTSERGWDGYLAFAVESHVIPRSHTYYVGYILRRVGVQVPGSTGLVPLTATQRHS